MSAYAIARPGRPGSPSTRCLSPGELRLARLCSPSTSWHQGSFSRRTMCSRPAAAGRFVSEISAGHYGVRRQRPWIRTATRPFPSFISETSAVGMCLYRMERSRPCTASATRLRAGRCSRGRAWMRSPFSWAIAMRTSLEPSTFVSSQMCADARCDVHGCWASSASCSVPSLAGRAGHRPGGGKLV